MSGLQKKTRSSNSNVLQHHTVTVSSLDLVKGRDITVTYYTEDGTKETVTGEITDRSMRSLKQMV